MKEIETFITIYFQRVIKKPFCSRSILRIVYKKKTNIWLTTLTMLLQFGMANQAAPITPLSIL